MVPFRHLVCGIALLCGAAALAQDEKPSGKSRAKAAAASVVLNDSRDRTSYGIGRNIGENISNDGLDLDLDLLARGIADAIAGSESPQTEEEFREALTDFQKTMSEKIVAKNDEFLKANGKKEGIKSLPSGLQYQVLKSGKGKKPTAKDSVKAHYKGSLLSGKVFDSSYDRGEPAEFPLSGVIKGWTEGVPLMQVGAKYKFWIPSDLAYGPRGRPPVIPPHSLLVFEIELLDVMAGEEDAGDDLPAPKLKLKK